MSRSRILVVDDDPGLRRTLERILAPTYRVETVAGVAEALARVEASRFDLALVDVRLKDGDGYTLCSALRERWPRMDVILITGSISEPDEKLFRSLEEGAFYFLFKPFDRRVLLALVERCLQLQQERFAKERYAEELAADLEKARLFQQSLRGGRLRQQIFGRRTPIVGPEREILAQPIDQFLKLGDVHRLPVPPRSGPS